MLKANSLKILFIVLLGLNLQAQRQKLIISEVADFLIFESQVIKTLEALEKDVLLLKNQSRYEDKIDSLRLKVDKLWSLKNQSKRIWVHNNKHV